MSAQLRQSLPIRATSALAAVIAVLAVLAVLAVAAAPARASFTVTGGSVSGSATDATWNAAISCPRSDLTGTVSGSQITARLAFAGIPRVSTCRTVWGISVTIVCTGTWTLTATNSVAGISASGTITLDAGASCGFSYPPCRGSANGPQGPFAGWTYSQATQTLTLRFRGLRGGCLDSPSVTFAITPSLTIS